MWNPVYLFFTSFCVETSVFDLYVESMSCILLDFICRNFLQKYYFVENSVEYTPHRNPTAETYIYNTLPMTFSSVFFSCFLLNPDTPLPFF